MIPVLAAAAGNIKSVAAKIKKYPLNWLYIVSFLVDDLSISSYHFNKFTYLKKMTKYLFWGLISVMVLGFFVLINPALAFDSMTPTVKVFNAQNRHLDNQFLSFGEGFRGGAKIAVGDINNDKKLEIIVGAGVGGSPQVRMFDNKGKFTGFSFTPFASNYRGGVDVALGDTDGDKKAELIVSQLSGGQSWVKVYELDAKKTVKSSFIAFGRSFTGGAHVAACDISGNGKAEVLVGSGVGSTSHIRAFDEKGRYVGFDIFPFEENYRGGADVACANVDGGKESEVVAAKSSFGTAEIKVYKTDRSKRILGDFLAYGSGHKEGANVVGGDTDGDGKDEIIVGTNGNGPQVKVFKAHGAPIAYSLTPYAADFRGGVNVAYGNLDNKKPGEILTSPGRRTWEGRSGIYKYIEVDISDQKLYAYKAGRKVKEFYVSTGVYKYPTPIGDFSVRTKSGSVRMKHSYGPNHPDNYDIAGVPNTMYFNPPFALHGAYWHHNFGHRMSHGCINLPLAEAAWLYGWSEIGDKVFVRP